MSFALKRSTGPKARSTGPKARSTGAANDLKKELKIDWLSNIYRQKDKLWLLVWLGGILLLTLWNIFFLNRPAFLQIRQGFLNTFFIASLVILFSFMLSWITANSLYFLEQLGNRLPYLLLNFLLNILRSIPQIIGILVGYVLLTMLIQQNILRSQWITMICQAGLISLFVFQEVVDLMLERIAYFKQRDFYNAMLVCGIPEPHIINLEILWKNSLTHIFNKLIAIFGTTIFLLCSVDFIISVGLSTAVSAVNLPTTLGNLLAKIDSKQDVLAIGNTVTQISYFPRLFFEHLQGITLAFLIVFSLLCIYKIANGFANRLDR